ncbi:hypothetical protein [Pseudobacteroides cellulosolvens]|uniref:Ribbon-helix-helix protein CopG domain-containing protein n=1 Tax=Pseudobacteroides cellulosolvens ATCC 35603 = DSM 2933 TaxID=398512 RepID=A0A0L6JXL1_9FIRM|nr:hypothetical protein [Pseudobacteroides cellulosolvens]KNY30182.1 hypothetical protein Bccel_5459 [Pseudobacteroides cellulosolvens ATCC 35603 = DSM 2933]
MGFPPTRKQLTGSAGNEVLAAFLVIHWVTSGKEGFVKDRPKSNTPKTQKRSVVFSTETLEQIEKLAVKKNVFASDIIREFVEKGLAVNGYEENIDTITAIIHQEIETSIKSLANRLAGMINRLTIISAAGYYANIAIISDLIDKDRYSSFEKIEKLARKRALVYANMKSADAIAVFMDDEEMKKAIAEVKGGTAAYVDFDV